MIPETIIKALPKRDLPQPEVTIDGDVARLHYASMDDWNAHISGDAEALRKNLRGIVEIWSDEGQSARAADTVTGKSRVAPVLCIRFAAK